MKRRALIAAAFVLSTPSDGLARHYTYMQENPSGRSRFSEIYPFNAVLGGPGRHILPTGLTTAVSRGT